MSGKQHSFRPGSEVDSVQDGALRNAKKLYKALFGNGGSGQNQNQAGAAKGKAKGDGGAKGESPPHHTSPCTRHPFGAPGWSNNYNKRKREDWEKGGGKGQTDLSQVNFLCASCLEPIAMCFSQVKCFKCNNMGHYAHSCPQKKK